MKFSKLHWCCGWEALHYPKACRSTGLPTTTTNSVSLLYC